MPYDPKAAAKELLAAGCGDPDRMAAAGRQGSRDDRAAHRRRGHEPARLYAIATQIAADWKAIGLPVRFTVMSADQAINQKLVPGVYDAAVVDLERGAWTPTCTPCSRPRRRRWADRT